MPFDLVNKVAVITGGGSGIGKAIAQIFAKQHARVNILDRDEKSGAQAVEEITQAGGSATFHAVDVSNQKGMVQTVDSIAMKAGKIDILVSSAGIAQVARLENTSEADFDKIYSVNVKGTYNAMLAVIPHFTKQNQGVILNLASVAALVGVGDRFAYSMSKGAVLSMTISVAKDYVKQGIRCNCISPGRVHTPFVDGFIRANYPGREAEMFEKLSRTQPVGRMAKPEEIAHLALYLCSDEASFVTGCDYPIDGGSIRLTM